MRKSFFTHLEQVLGFFGFHGSANRVKDENNSSSVLNVINEIAALEFAKDLINNSEIPRFYKSYLMGQITIQIVVLKLKVKSK